MAYTSTKITTMGTSSVATPVRLRQASTRLLQAPARLRELLTRPRWASLRACRALSAIAMLALPITSQAQQLEHFLGWFAGEYDNNEQVWQQGEDGIAPEQRHEHIHHIFVPTSVPAVGEHVFFVKQYLGRDYEDVYRQRLYRFSDNEQRGAIELAIYNFHDEEPYRYADRDPTVLADLTLEELRNVPGCNVYWRFAEDHYVGEMDEGACFYHSENMGQNIYITDTLRLTEDEIWIGDKAYDEDGNMLFGHEEPHRNRKVRQFSGWGGVRRSAFAPDAEDGDEMLFIPALRLHNEGQIVPLLTEQGEATGYDVELARLTYQNTRVAVLKLGILDSATGKTVAYSWANPGAGRIGINLGWLQVGLTADDL